LKPKKLLIQIGTMLLKIAALILAAFVLYKVAGLMYNYGFRIFAEEAVDRKPGIDVNVAIVEGKSVKEIGKLLEEKGLIKSGSLFVWQVKFSEYADDLKPGQYTLNTSMTPYEMMAVMAAEEEEEDDGTSMVTQTTESSEGSETESEAGSEEAPAEGDTPAEGE
jgi:UPF0755 protein